MSMFEKGVDKEKVMSIGLEMMPLGVEFERKLKEVAKKYGTDHLAETNEALLNILAALIHSLANEGKVLHLMIELLHREYIGERIKEIIPPDQAERFMGELKEGKSTPDELKNFITKLLKENKQETRKSSSDNKPDYLG